MAASNSNPLGASASAQAPTLSATPAAIFYRGKAATMLRDPKIQILKTGLSAAASDEKAEDPFAFVVQNVEKDMLKEALLKSSPRTAFIFLRSLSAEKLGISDTLDICAHFSSDKSFMADIKEESTSKTKKLDLQSRVELDDDSDKMLEKIKAHEGLLGVYNTLHPAAMLYQAAGIRAKK